MISSSRLGKQTENTKRAARRCGELRERGGTEGSRPGAKRCAQTRRPSPGQAAYPLLASRKSSRKILMGGSILFPRTVKPAPASPGRHKPGSWLLRSRALDRLRGEGLPVPERSKSSAKELAPAQSSSAARASDVLSALPSREMQRESVRTDPAHVDRGEDSRRTGSFS